jgi:hypothetical protein
LERGGSHPAALFSFICFGDLPGGLPKTLEAAKIDARARAAAVFDDALDDAGWGGVPAIWRHRR